MCNCAAMHMAVYCSGFCNKHTNARNDLLCVECDVKPYTLTHPRPTAVKHITTRPLRQCQRTQTRPSVDRAICKIVHMQPEPCLCRNVIATQHAYLISLIDRMQSSDIRAFLLRLSQSLI